MTPNNVKGQALLFSEALKIFLVCAAKVSEAAAFVFGWELTAA